ncbi:MAG: sodium:proton antiporter [Alkalinema sp. RL_2_19]|nr:sodium:proton antiporter [Alkalinema sp. RL_2_19]
MATAVAAEVAAEAAIESNLKAFLLVLSVSLGVATLPQMISWFRQIPYTLLLVIVGLGLAFVDIRLVDLSPGLILSIFLPPLLFEAAWNLRWTALKKDWLPITLYALLGVVIAIVGIGFGVSQWTTLPIASALLLGASLSATDPVSVTALFRELGADKRLTTLMEGESLFNDGMAVVAFGFLLGIPMGTASLSLQSSIIELFTVVGIGAGIGGLMGFGISYLTQRFDLPLVEQSLTLVSAYAAYLITEDLGGSGVIAVVTTAMILGNFGSRIGMNPRTRIIVSEFWEFLAFFVNSIVFLLIGDQVQFDVLAANLPTIGITIAAMTVARAISVFLLGGASNWMAQSEIPMTTQIVLWWGGLRGSVSIALALSIPASLADRQVIIAHGILGVVLFTLLVQGLTTKPLLQKLGLVGNQELQEEYSEALARQIALKRSLNHLQTAETRPGIDEDFIGYQTALITGEIERLQENIETLKDEYPDLEVFIEKQLREELLAVEADAYAEFISAGWLNRELAPFLQNRAGNSSH